MYEDKPIYFDNWDIDIYYTEKYWDVDTVEHMEWTEIGAVRAVLEITRKASQSTIQQNIIFYADSRRIEFVTYVDWKEHQTLLKVHFQWRCVHRRGGIRRAVWQSDPQDAPEHKLGCGAL